MEPMLRSLNSVTQLVIHHLCSRHILSLGFMVAFPCIPCKLLAGMAPPTGSVLLVSVSLGASMMPTI